MILLSYQCFFHQLKVNLTKNWCITLFHTCRRPECSISCELIMKSEQTVFGYFSPHFLVIMFASLKSLLDYELINDLKKNDMSPFPGWSLSCCPIHHWVGLHLTYIYVHQTEANPGNQQIGKKRYNEKMEKQISKIKKHKNKQRRKTRKNRKPKKNDGLAHLFFFCFFVLFFNLFLFVFLFIFFCPVFSFLFLVYFPVFF